MNSRQVLAVVVCIAALVYEIYAIFIATHGAPVNTLSDRRLLAGEIAGEHVVSQTFVTKAPGLSSLTLYPAPFGQEVDGTVELELLRLRADDNAQLVFRTTRSARDVAATPTLRLDFPPLSDSDGASFRLDVRLPDAPAGHGLGLWANRENTYRDGTLLVDGREQWGDLAFAAEAPTATAFRQLQSLFRSKAAWLGSPLALLLLFVLYNTALFAFVFTAVRHAPARDKPRTALVSSQKLTVAVAVVMLVLMSSVVAVRWLNGRNLEPGAIDLIELFPDAEKRTVHPDLHTWFDIIDVTIKGDTKPSIFAHAPSRIIWRVEIPPRAVLRVSAAIRPDLWTQESDGAAFRVGISDGREYKEYFRRYLMPYTVHNHRAWISAEVDLSLYAGQKVEVIFNTDPGALNAVRDACVWGLPRIVPNAVR